MSPFLKMGLTFAISRSAGSWPVRIDWLKIAANAKHSKLFMQL